MTPLACHLHEHTLPLWDMWAHPCGLCWLASALPLESPSQGSGTLLEFNRLVWAIWSLLWHCLLLSFWPLYLFCFLCSGFCFMDLLSNHPVEKTPSLLPMFNLLESPLD